MRRVALLLLLAAGCAADDPPPAPAPPKLPASPPPLAASPKPPASPPPPAAKAVEPPPAPPPPAPEVAPPPPAPEGGLWTPLFTFRSLDGNAAVSINGEPAGATPLSWAVSERTAFDPRIPVEAWPPPEAVFAARGGRRNDEGVWTSMELWIAAGRGYPHLAPGEQVLFVKAVLGSCERRGALRLRVDGRRFVAYMPTHVTEESEDFHKWARSLWFERE